MKIPATNPVTPTKHRVSEPADQVNASKVAAVFYIRRNMAQVISNDQLIALAKQFGTPLYVYHAEKIKEQFGKLQKAFAKTDARFFYACKALTNINVLKYVRSLGAGLDCVSIN